jgi:hypothetical protein
VLENRVATMKGVWLGQIPSEHGKQSGYRFPQSKVVQEIQK